MTYKEYYLKQHPESASIIDEIIKQRCPAEVVNCKYSIANQSDCFYQKAPPTADVEVICEACWNQKMKENIKEEKEKKNMTYKELWIALHPGKEFIHDNEWEGECPDDFGYEPKDYHCPKNNGSEDCKYCWDREVPEETIEKFFGKKTIKTPKFKVGDRVKVTSPVSGCTGAKHKIGTVTNEKARNGLYDSELFPTIHIKLEESGSTWCVNEDGCILLNKESANTVSHTEKTPKFKVGDKVLVIHPAAGCTGCEDEIGIVTTKEASNGLLGNEPYPTINIKIQDINSVCYNQIWCVNEDGCELITKAPAPEKTTDDFPCFNDWTGKIIKLESGKVYLVVLFDDYYALLSPEGNIVRVFEPISPSILDDKITEVYQIAKGHNTLSGALSFLPLNQLLWKAKEKKKMSYEDIVAAFGYDFELV